jgi:transposase
MQAITIGLDIAKSVIQVHGIDAEGQVVIRRQLKRRYVLAFFEKLAPSLIGIEACASSHHWSRQLQMHEGTTFTVSLPACKPIIRAFRMKKSGWIALGLSALEACFLPGGMALAQSAPVPVGN